MSYLNSAEERVNSPIGNAHTRREEGGVSEKPPAFNSGGTIQKKGDKGDEPKTLELSICADKEAPMLSKRYFKQAAVGHSWVIVKDEKGNEDSFGFWPKMWVDEDGQRHGGFNPSQPGKDVPGQVRNPDEAHRDKITSKQTVKISHSQYEEGKKYAASKSAVNYNLLKYNCTHFAKEFFTEASGVAAPSSWSLIPDNPNALNKDIKKSNKKKGLDQMEQFLPGKKAARRRLKHGITP